MQVNDKVNINLTAQDWQLIVNILSEVAYKVTAPLISQIQTQFAQQETAMTDSLISPSSGNNLLAN